MKTLSIAALTLALLPAVPAATAASHLPNLSAACWSAPMA
jgi:hypothetical protein